MALMRFKRRQSGFSLVELMVGMLLGIMLLAGAASIYLASKQSYVEVEQVGALSENARFAEQVLGDSLRHMGFIGETSPGNVRPDSNLGAVTGDCTGNAAAYDLTRLGIAATSDISGNALGCIDDAVPNTDVLAIKRALPRPYTDGARDDPNNPSVPSGTIDTPTALQGDRTYVMTNNVGGLIFDGADTPPTITTGGELPNGTAWEYYFEVFYLRDTDPASTDDPPQLSRKVLRWNAGAMALVTEDVAEGVEILHFLFGVDSDNDGEVDSYTNAAGVTNWNQVESVEVYMLVRSATPDVNYTDGKTYQLGDLTVLPADLDQRFRRLISHTSVSLRNLKLIIRGDA